MSKTDRTFWICTLFLVASLIIFCLVNIAHGQECSYKFPQKDASKIVTVMEKYDQCTALVSALEEQCAVAQGMADSYAHALAAQEQANEELKTLSKLKAEQCAKQIEAAKPTFWEKLKTGGYGAVIGGLCAIILMGL